MSTDIQDQTRLGRDDRFLLLAVLLAGLIPVFATIAHGGVWGSEPTLGLLMVVYASSVLALAMVTRLRHWLMRGH